MKLNFKLKKLEIIIIGYLLFLLLTILSQNKFLVILSLMVFDKVLLSQLRVQGYFGIELLSVPIILIAVTQGPLVAFLFGTFGIPLLDVLRWILAPPIHPTSPPFIPSISSLLYGSMGALAAFMHPSFDLIAIVLTTSILGDALHGIGMLFMGQPPNPVSYVINIVQNYFIMNLFIAIGFVKFLGIV
ncbi:MAG: hypothetical protein HY361_02965 [Candidatus Aenigmarchaeota archaeon]|nr:hypothetical protein [Candidatus Aenigmarchaeota archaeon]